MNWYALTVQPGHEEHVRSLLEDHGLWVYCPIGIRTFWHRRNKVNVTQFYNPFSGYLFVLVDELEGPWSTFSQCGARVLKNQGSPVKVSPEVIDQIIEAEENGVFNDQRNSNLKKVHPFELGDKVSFDVLGETITGVIKALKGSKKVVVKANKFGKNIKAEFLYDRVRKARA